MRQHVIIIVDKTSNNGSYPWSIPTNLKYGENYIIQVKDVDSNVYGLSERFIIYSEKKLQQFYTIIVILFISIPSSIVLLYYLIRLRRKKKKKKLDGS
ncbi:MAG: Ser-Thr-rich GPI-anchored membrane family protein [Promethearchaeota archaeon]